MPSRPTRAAGCPREDPRRRLGRLGEDLAAAHLERLGLAMLARNVRTRHGEIDLIAFDGGTLVFVEVKTRARSARGARPRMSCMLRSRGSRVRQRSRLRRLAAAWLAAGAHATCRARRSASTRSA